MTNIRVFGKREGRAILATLLAEANWESEVVEIDDEKKVLFIVGQHPFIEASRQDNLPTFFGDDAMGLHGFINVKMSNEVHPEYGTAKFKIPFCAVKYMTSKSYKKLWDSVLSHAKNGWTLELISRRMYDALYVKHDYDESKRLASSVICTYQDKHDLESIGTAVTQARAHKEILDEYRISQCPLCGQDSMTKVSL